MVTLTCYSNINDLNPNCSILIGDFNARSSKWWALDKDSPEGHVIDRSSHRSCSIKGVLSNFAKFIGKHLCQSVFFNKVAGLRPATLLKKRLKRRCFPVNFTKFTRTPFLQNTSGGCFWIESLTLATGNSQLISQGTHITNTLTHMSSTCIDLIFTTNSSFA